MMWGEGASDLWGHLEEEEYERELEMIDGVENHPAARCQRNRRSTSRSRRPGSEQARPFSSHSRRSVR